MKKILLAAIITTTLFACKKKTEDVPAPAPLEDYSLAGYLQKTGFNQKEAIVPSFGIAAEIGIVFEPKVAGSITAFTVKFPAPSNNLKIIVWDATTAQPIASKTFNYIGVAVGSDFTIPVTPIPLQKNAKYCVSYTPISGIYIRKKTDLNSATYPIEFKNLTILSHNVQQLSNINLRQYPYIKVDNEYYGDISFTFQ